MNLITQRVDYHSRSDEFRLYHLTDMHIGARACDEKLLKQHIRQIEDDPFALVTLGGDNTDAIGRKGDKRARESALAPWCWGKDDVLQTQVDYLNHNILTPRLCQKIIAVAGGNHEDAPDMYQGSSVYRTIVKHVADQKGVPPASIALGFNGYVQLRFRRVNKTGTYGSGWNLTLYITHGYGGGKLAGGHALELERILGRYECDIALMGHRHTEAYVPMVSTRVVGDRIVQTKRVAMLLPGYLGGGAELRKDELPLMTYDALKGYYPTTRGTTPILIDPNERLFYPVFSGGNGVMQRLPKLGMPPVEVMTGKPNPRKMRRKAQSEEKAA